MPSELSLYNDALAHLGEDTVLDDAAADPAPRALRVFKALLPSLRDAMLRKHPWLCAESRSTVTRQPLVGNADWKFLNAFLLPPETLRLWTADTNLTYQVGPLTLRDGSGVVTSRRKALFCDHIGPLKIVTIDRIDYEHMDPCLADAMAYELASRAAGPLQADKALKKALKDDAREAMAYAVTVETSEFTDDVVLPKGRFLSSR